MEDMETRVWQRVLAQPEQPQGEDLRLMIVYAQELAAAYGRLMKETSGRNRELLRRLYEGERANVACLKGLSLLQGRQVKRNPIQASREPAQKLLEKCYHRTRRAMAEYMARSAAPEFGEVFRAMADREGEHCEWIAQVLGMMG